MQTKKYTKTNAILFGITAIIIQIVLIREFMLVFYGNELVVGLILASWLFWVALGSQIGNRLKNKICTLRFFFLLQVLNVITAFLAIFLSKIIRLIAGVPIGEYVSIFDITWTSFAILSTPCFLIGLQFALLASIAKYDTKIGDPSAHVYIFESLGSFVGSLIFSLLVVSWLSDLQSLLLLLTVITFAAGIELNRKCFFIGALFFLIIMLSPIPRNLESRLVQLQWRTFNCDFNLADWENSRYGQLAVIDWGGEKSLYYNERKQTTIPDPIGSQQIAHLVMNQHSDPHSILLIGGGMGGFVKEILKYSGVTLDYLELDEKVYSVMQKHLPAEDSLLWNNPNLQIYHLDGRYFLRQTDRYYGLIIVNVGEPATASSNRFYTLEFFRDAKSRLDNDGILALCNVPSAVNYFGPEMLELNASIYHTVQRIFDHILVIPGESAIFLASNITGALTIDTKILSSRYDERDIECNYFFKELFWQFMLPDRIAFVQENLKSVQNPIINRDFRPISYYFDLLLWNKIVRGGGKLLPLLGLFRLSSFALAMCIFFAIYLSVVAILKLIYSPKASFSHRAWERVVPRRMSFSHKAWERVVQKMNVIILTFAVGFAGIVFSVVLILAFQTVFGYIYELVGLALSGFMAGLAVGSYIFNRKRAVWLKWKFTLPVLSIGVAGFAALLPLLLDILLVWRSYVLFFAYLLIAGFLVGTVFPVACHEFYRVTGRRRVGTIYAADLAGGCLGSLLASAILVPILGLYQVCWLAALLVVLSVFAYAIANKR